jgi:hypothetical protein
LSGELFTGMFVQRKDFSLGPADDFPFLTLNMKCGEQEYLNMVLFNLVKVHPEFEVLAENSSVKLPTWLEDDTIRSIKLAQFIEHRRRDK